MTKFKMLEANGWTLVSEKTPSENTEVFAYTSSGLILYDMIYKSEDNVGVDWMTRRSLWNGLVIAWMEKPKAPVVERMDN